MYIALVWTVKYWFCHENGKKNNYPQVYLEECKYEVKKKKKPEFIEVESDSDSE